MKPFILLRVEDVSGSSGTGRVAEGVESSNGWVVLFFEDSMKLFLSIDKMMEVHGHGGRTRLHYINKGRTLLDRLNPGLVKRLRALAEGRRAPITPTDVREILALLDMPVRQWLPMPLPREEGLYLVRNSPSDPRPSCVLVQVAEDFGPETRSLEEVVYGEWTPLQL